MTRSLYGLLALGVVLATASLPLYGQGDPCAGNLSVSPTSLQYNAQGAPVTPFTVTASPACTWLFQYLDGDSFILPQNYGTGTVVFDLKLNPLLASPNHLSTTKTEHFRVASLQTTNSATVTATQDPALTMSMSCPKATNPVIWACTGSVGVPFFASAIATGGKSPYVTSTDQVHFPTGLPPGLSSIGLTLNTSTGIISGTPTAGGSFSLSIYMMDADGAVTAALVDIEIASNPCNYTLSGPAVVPGLSRYTYQIGLPADNNASGIAWSASTSTATITPKSDPTGAYVAFQNVKPDWVTLEAKFTLDKKPECAMKQVAVVKVAVDTPTFTTQGKADSTGDSADVFQLNPPAPPQPSDWVIYHDPGSAWQAFTYKDCVAHPATCKQAAEPSKAVSSRAGGFVAAFQANTKVTLTSPPEMPTAQQKIQVGFIQHGSDDGSAVYDHNSKLVRTVATPTSYTVDWLFASAGPGGNDDWPWYNKLTARQTGTGSNSWSTVLSYSDSPNTTFPAEYNPNNQVPERHKKIETAQETMFFIVRMAARTLDSTAGADQHYFSEGEATWTVKYVWPVVENVGIAKVGPTPWAAPTVPNEINVNAVPMNININIPYARWIPN